MKATLHPLRNLFAIIVLATLAFNQVVQASSGTVNEVTLPSGVSIKNTAVTESWMLAASSTEILVYSNASGTLVRRLRPGHTPGVNFGKYIAAAGDFVVVSDDVSTICAFNCATGKHLWDASVPNVGLVRSLATDGIRVAAGEPDSSSPTSLILFEGVVSIFDAANGQLLVRDKTIWGQSHALYGDAVAVSGPWLAVGAPAYDISGLINNGAVVVKNLSGTENMIVAPGGQNADGFGSSVAISGNTLYVGTNFRDRVYLYDLRTLAFIRAVDEPSAAITGFGQELAASGHLLIINSADGAWLYDRQSDVLTSIFAGAGGPGPVQRGASLCGGYAAAPDAGKLLRAKNVGSTLGGSEVAAVGDVLGGPGVVKLGSFGDASLNGAGAAAFTVRQVGSGVSSATDMSVWQGGAGSNARIMREGTVYGSSKADVGTLPSFSEDETSTFWLNRSSKGLVSLWRYTGGATASLIQPGSLVTFVGTPNMPLLKLHAYGAVQSTGVAIMGTLKIGGTVDADSNSVLFRPGLISAAEAWEGQASGLVGALYAEISPRVATAGSRMAYSSFLTGRMANQNAAVFTKTIGSAPIAAMEKGDSPVGVAGQFPDAVMSSFIGEAICNGALVMRGTYKTATFTAEALMSYNHGTGADHSVAWVRGQVPGLPSGVTWKRFLKVFVAENGDTFFLAQIGGTGVNLTNDIGFWHCALGSTKPKLLVRESDSLAGAGGAKIGIIQQVDAHRDGTWSLLASLSNSPAAWNQILVGGNIASDLGFEVIARKGIAVDRPAASALLGLALPTGNTSATGMASGGTCRFARDGKVLHRAIYKESTALTVSSIWGY